MSETEVIKQLILNSLSKPIDLETDKKNAHLLLYILKDADALNDLITIIKAITYKEAKNWETLDSCEVISKLLPPNMVRNIIYEYYDNQSEIAFKQR